MNKPFLLVVEDDSAIRNLIAATLETQGYHFHVSTTGSEAISEAVTHNPDVVLLDQVLCPMSQSAYYTVQRKAGPDFDWCPKVENGRVVAMDITDAYRPSMLGISYWNAHDCEIIKAEIERRLKDSANYLDPKNKNGTKKDFYTTEAVDAVLAEYESLEADL